MNFGLYIQATEGGEGKVLVKKNECMPRTCEKERGMLEECKESSKVGAPRARGREL